jgi:single-strand DNA-binding protein
MLNSVCLIGHLGADPDIRRTNEGKPIANFRIATTEKWKDRNTGEARERTEWHSIVVFSEGLAGVVEKYLKKGSKVYVQGKLQTRKWEDKDNVTRYTTEVVLNGFDAKLVMLDSAGSGRPPAANPEDYGQESRPSRSSSGKPQEQQDSFDKDLDDAIPF